MKSVNQVPDDRKRTYTQFQCAKAPQRPALKGSQARMVVLYRSGGSWLGIDDSGFFSRGCWKRGGSILSMRVQVRFKQTAS